MPDFLTILFAMMTGLLVLDSHSPARAEQIVESQQQDCTPANGLEFLCGPRNVEDMIRLPGRAALIGSSSLGPGAPTGPAAQSGKLYFIDTRARAYVQLVPDISGKPQSEYSACPGAPNVVKFSPHGIAIRRGSQGHHLLYVVNHGGRESIEMFTVNVATSIGLKWIGCVILPDGALGNGVVPLRDGGFVATKFIDTRHGNMLDQLAALEKTGAVYRWRPGKGFTTLPGSVMSGNNGVETSADGKWLFVDVWPEKRIVRFALDGDVAPVSIPLDFLPDNIHRMPDDSLLIAGQSGDIQALSLRYKLQQPIDWVVAWLDPQNLRVIPLLREKGTPVFSNVSGAAQVGNALWLGSVHGDRVAIKLLP
ncbi:MAG: hypothetical protein AB7T07_04020 [Steroidobacteraceae bacterium]